VHPPYGRRELGATRPGGTRPGVYRVRSIRSFNCEYSVLALCHIVFKFGQSSKFQVEIDAWSVVLISETMLNLSE
jgi:hypothetical protein